MWFCLTLFIAILFLGCFLLTWTGCSGDASGPNRSLAVITFL
jgi:hypothetical protein